MIQPREKSIYEILGRESVHPFPARMAPGIALQVVGDVKKPLRVLDPMMGSGTVLAIAHSKGHEAVGIDIDPLAVLISKVWTTAMDPKHVRDNATEVLDRAQGIFSTLPTRKAYPEHSDTETRRFISYWFDDHARRQLTALATAIAGGTDDFSRDFLWCAFSRLIVTKQSGASLAMDLAHSRPHKSFDRAPIKPFEKFLAAVDRVVKNCIDETSVGSGVTTRTYEGDARDLSLDDASIDLVLTSPPYLNAIDYMRCSKFSLVWMGYRIDELRRLRAVSVGAERGYSTALDDKNIREILAKLKLRPALGARDKAVLLRYITDMQRALHEVTRVLVSGGKAVYVVGENTIRGTYIRNSVIISALARFAGLKFQSKRIRTLPANRRYLPPPPADGGPAALDGRMRREVVLAFTKP